MQNVTLNRPSAFTNSALLFAAIVAGLTTLRAAVAMVAGV